MKSKLLFFFILLIAFSCGIQKEKSQSREFKSIFQTLDNAFIAKDTSVLSNLLHQNLSLGHSNGWLETKPDLLKTLIDGGVIYTSIETIGEPKIHYSSEKLKTTRRNIDVSGIVNETPFDVKLNVLEVWTLENSNWKLLARQSVNRRE